MRTTDDYYTVAKSMLALLEARAPELGLEKVWYGDQQRVSEFPSAAVEPAPTEYSRYGTGHQYAIQFNLAIMVYYAQVVSEEELKEESDAFAMRVMRAVNSDRNLDGLIVHGNVTRVEPGLARRSGAKFRATRIFWEGIGRAMI